MKRLFAATLLLCTIVTGFVAPDSIAAQTGEVEYFSARYLVEAGDTLTFLYPGAPFGPSTKIYDFRVVEGDVVKLGETGVFQYTAPTDFEHIFNSSARIQLWTKDLLSTNSDWEYVSNLRVEFGNVFGPRLTDQSRTYFIERGITAPISFTVVIVPGFSYVQVFSLRTAPGKGTLAYESSASPPGTLNFTYAPNEGASGSDAFVFDMSEDCCRVAALLTINIVFIDPENPTPAPDPDDPPEPEPISDKHIAITGDPRFAILGSVAQFGSTPGLAYVLGSPPAFGTVTVATDGTFLYIASDTTQPGDAFTVLVTDGSGDSATIMVSLVFDIDESVPTTGTVVPGKGGNGDGNGGETGTQPADPRSPVTAPVTTPTPEPGDDAGNDSCTRCN